MTFIELTQAQVILGGAAILLTGMILGLASVISSLAHQRKRRLWDDSKDREFPPRGTLMAARERERMHRLARDLRN